MKQKRLATILMLVLYFFRVELAISDGFVGKLFCETDAATDATLEAMSSCRKEANNFHKQVPGSEACAATRETVTTRCINLKDYRMRECVQCFCESVCSQSPNSESLECRSVLVEMNRNSCSFDYEYPDGFYCKGLIDAFWNTFKCSLVPASIVVR